VQINSYSLCNWPRIQDLDDKRERALKGLNTALAWLEEAIVISDMLAHALITCMSSLKASSALHVWQNGDLPFCLHGD